MKRFSTSSNRQSLGMPSRGLVSENVDFEPTRKSEAVRKSKIPVGLASGASQQARRKTYNKPAAPSNPQYNRRQTASQLGSRPSTGRSSIYGQSHSQMKKDPRQLSEKANQSATIKKLIAFLVQENYPKTLTPKLLQLPSTKDFLAILNFLLERIDPCLVTDGMNITETIPRLLRAVRYPFPVSKNHLLNVGSPHSWPILLGVLDFLVDLCPTPDRTNDQLFGAPEFDEDEDVHEESSREFELMIIMYQTYLEYGLDSVEYQDIEQRRIQGLRETQMKYQEAVDKSVEQGRQLNEAIQELSLSSISALQENLQHLKAEQEGLVTELKSEVLPAIENIEQAINDIKAAKNSSEVQIEEHKRKAMEYEKVIQNQPMSSKEVQDIRQRMKEYHQTLDKYRDMRDSWGQQITDLQIEHNKTVTGIDDGCSQANDKLRRLAVELPEVASLSPLDHDSSKRSDPSVLHTLTHHAKSLRNELSGLTQKVATHCSELESKLISLDSSYLTLKNEKVCKQLEIENIEHKLHIEKEALSKKRKEFEDGIKSEQAEKHALEKQLMTLQEKLLLETEAQKENTSARKQLHSEVVTVQKELAEKQREFTEHFVAVADLIESVKNVNQTIRGGVDHLVKEYKKLKIPKVDPKYLDP